MQKCRGKNISLGFDLPPIWCRATVVATPFGEGDCFLENSFITLMKAVKIPVPLSAGVARRWWGITTPYWLKKRGECSDCLSLGFDAVTTSAGRESAPEMRQTRW
jgi:hypothetical protein